MRSKLSKLLPFVCPALLFGGSALLQPARSAAAEENPAGLRPVPLRGSVASVQPFTGVVLWDTNEHRASDAIQLEFSYLGYAELVDETGDYDWGPAERKLDDIASRGHQAILRLYLVYPGKPSQVPVHLRSLPGYAETSAKSEGEDTVFPDWSHPALKAFVLDFHRAFAERYDEDPRLAFLQVGFGLWAEYHIYDGPFELGRTFPDRAFQGEFLRHLASVYRRTPFSISVDAAKPEAGPFGGDPSLLELPFGVFDDSLLNKEHAKWNLRDWEGVGLDRSRRAPAGGEFSYYNERDQRLALAPGGPHGESWESAARRFGLSYVVGDDQPRFQSLERIREAGLASGYRFRVVAFASGPGRSLVRIRNEGVAPICHDAHPAVDGVRAAASLKGLAPGAEADFEIPAGGEAPSVSIECDRLVPGQSIGFDADLEGTGDPALPEQAKDAGPGADPGEAPLLPDAAPPPETSPRAAAPAPATGSEPETGPGGGGGGGGASAAFLLAGGIGLFLLGMSLLTDGVKAYAGPSLRRGLLRFAGTPAKAFLSGMLATMLLQSSSATTVTVIGFVSAGLLSFPQAVGVIFGASLGTTATGWLVAGLGLKFSVGLYALPIVGLGAFLHLLASGKARAFGTALAGFGLIFGGIDHLQEGMAGLSGRIGPLGIPSGSLGAHLAAMALGVLMTVAMQSSSAAVATILAALHTGTIPFEQAAALVVGAAIGTTVTGVIAAIGGTVPAKRTALAHVLFNLAAGVLAVLLLPLLLRAIVLAQEHLGLEGGALGLAAFHTLFIGLGVVLFLPFVRRFASAIEAILPDRGPALTRHLDRSVLKAPSVAVEASRRALAGIAVGAFDLLRASLGHPPKPPSQLATPAQLREALDRVREFLPMIPDIVGDPPLSAARLSLVHAMDHLERLLSKLDPLRLARQSGEDGGAPLAQSARLAEEILVLAGEGLRGDSSEARWCDEVEARAGALAELRRTSRPLLIAESDRSGFDPVETLARLDRMRWHDRIGFHAWRTCRHLVEELPLAEAPVDDGEASEGGEKDLGIPA